MNLFGLMIVRNEEWILGLSARAALKWCDALVIFDHASTDKTPEVMYRLSQEYPGRIHCMSDRDGSKWDEMAHRDMTMIEARKNGATHMAIVDADEVITGNLLGVVRSQIESMKTGQVLEYPMISCWRSLDKYRNDDSIWSKSAISVAWKDEPHIRWKAAGDGYQHHNRVPYGCQWSRLKPHNNKEQGGIMHLQWANWRRLVSKQNWYKMVETVRWPGRRKPDQLRDQFGQAYDEKGIRLEPTKPEWWSPYREWFTYADLTITPWYEEDMRRMMLEYGPGYFEGLDLRCAATEGPMIKGEGLKGNQLWICDSCRSGGIIIRKDKDDSMDVRNRILKYHQRCAPLCGGHKMKVIVLSSITEDTIFERMDG